MGGSGSRAAADRAGPTRCRALSLAHRSSLIRARYAMFIRRVWSRLRKPATGPSSVESSAQPDASARRDDSTRAASFVGAVSTAADERIQWRRPGRDRRKGWSFRKLRNEPALPSPDVAATPPTKFDTAVSTVAEGETQNPSPTAGTATVDYLGPTSEPAEADDDYAVLADDDDINWSAGYVKLCYMPEGMSQDCSSFQDLRKVQSETPTVLAQRQEIEDGLQNVGDGPFVFGSPTDRVFDGGATLRRAEQQSACRLEKQPTKSDTMTEWEEVLFNTTDDSTDLPATAQETRPDWITEGTRFAVVENRETGAIPKRMTSFRVSEKESAQPQQTSFQASTSTGTLAGELAEARRCDGAYTACTEKCPVGLLIQPQQPQQLQQQCAASDAANRPPDSLLDGGSFLRSLQRSPLVDFPPPHPPASDQMFWAADRGSLENYAATGDSGATTWPVPDNCSGSAVSSDDSVFACKAATVSHQRDLVASRESFDESATAGIFMFSDDDDDNLCGSIGGGCSGPLRASGNLFQAGAREPTAQRENGSGDSSHRVVELVVHT